MQGDDGIKKSPYKGILIICFILIVIPILFYFLMKNVINAFQKQYAEELNNYAALFLGFGLGFFFQFSCVIGGMFKGTLSVVIKRIVNFFGNLSVSLKFALKVYFYELKEDGVVFWILFIIVFSTLLICIYGFIGFNNLNPII